jgi:hypothetical protein
MAIFGLMIMSMSAGWMGQSATPVQTCELRTEAWCLLRSGVRVDERTVDNDRRLWDFHGSYLGDAHVTMMEDRGCSAASSDFQSRSEREAPSAIDGTPKYIVEWKLRRDGSCTLRLEIPIKDGKKDPVAYDFVVRGLRACMDRSCSGPSLLETPAEPNRSK